MQNRPDFVDQNLKSTLTDVQKIRLAEALARSLQDVEILKDENKKRAHEFAERMDGLNQSIKKSFITLQNGYEYKWISCKILYNDPKPGEKTLMRMDTGELVRVEDMSFAECQETLPLTAVKEPEMMSADETEEIALRLLPDQEPAATAPQSTNAPEPESTTPETAPESPAPSKRKPGRPRKVLAMPSNGKDDQPHA